MIATFQADAIPDTAVWIGIAGFLLVIFVISLFLIWLVYLICGMFVVFKESHDGLEDACSKEVKKKSSNFRK